MTQQVVVDVVATRLREAVRELEGMGLDRAAIRTAVRQVADEMSVAESSAGGILSPIVGQA